MQVNVHIQCPGFHLDILQEKGVTRFEDFRRGNVLEDNTRIVTHKEEKFKESSTIQEGESE